MAASAKPGVPFSRPYTGFNGIAPGITGGLAQWIVEARRTSLGALWNNGAYGVRDVRGKPGHTSNHATGRAVDLSFRKQQHKPNLPSGRHAMYEWLERVVLHANTLGVELIIDYFPLDFGRAWRCDRQGWLDYDKPTVSGAPKGDWIHVEISPAFSKSATTVRKAFASVFPEIPSK